MKNQITNWMIVAFLCVLSSMGLKAQTYDSTEVATLKKVFATKSADGINNNGSKVGVSDTTNWNPATTPATGVVWTDFSGTYYVTEINWSNKGMAGAFAGSPLNALSKLEKANFSYNSFTSLRFGSKFLRELIISGNKTLALPSFWTADFIQITNMDSLRIYEAKNTNIGNVNYGTTSFRNLTTFIGDSSNISALTLSTAAGLPQLTTLSVIGNKLTDFTAPVLAAPLVSVACESNSINQFSKLPLQSSITSYTYAPQNDYWNLLSKYWMDTLDMSSEYAIVRGGITRYTTYTWFDITTGTEEGIPAGSITDYDNGKFSFAETLSGKRLRCKMTNNNFPGLTTIAEVVIYGYNAQEVAALKAFFALPSAKTDTTNGLALGVTDIANWNPAKQSASLQWSSSGAVRNVEYFYWGSKGVAGNLDLSVFTKIVSPNLSGNKLTKVIFNPAMTTISSAVYLNDNLLDSLILPEKPSAYSDVRIYNNKLKFSTLPKNKITSYKNAPQATINGGEIEYSATVDLSSEAFVTINGGTAETDYIWVDITDGTEKTVNGISSPARGKFTFHEILKGKTLRCKMTNDSLPQFKGDSVLKFEVKIEDSPAYDPAEVSAFKDFFKQAGMMGKTNGEWLGVTDVENWNPATENAHIDWDNETTKRVVEISWTSSNLAGQLNLKPMQKLTNISLDKNNIQKVVFADTASLLSIILAGETKIDTMILPKSAPKLTTVQCFASQLTALTIPSDALQLKDLRVHIAKIKSLILPQVTMPELIYLWVYDNQLTEIVLPPAMPMLRYLYLYNNRLTNITMPTQYMNNLQYMFTEGNALTFATLPAYPKTLTGHGGGFYSATPQDTMQGGTIDVTDTIDLSSQYKTTTVKGDEATTVYTWYRIVSGEEQSINEGITDIGNGKFVLSSNMTGKSLRCKMTNANYPEFTDNHQGGIVKTYNTGMVYDVKINGTEAISNIDASNIHIYPNPAKTIVNVEGINIQKVEIYNALGSLLDTQVNKSSQINVSKLQAGVHILRIYTMHGEIINKQIMISQ